MNDMKRLLKYAGPYKKDMLLGAVPVSYTHLDVYKRQLEITNDGRETNLEKYCAPHKMDPVSYTHLDVYKRQFLNCLE